MIKKFLSMVAIAGMVFTTSCSSDEFEPAQNGGEAVVSFTTQLPSSLQSRAFGDGTNATNLSYFVYDENWTYLTALSAEDSITMGADLKATVNLQLVNGETYNVVFWADAEDAPYTFNKGEATVAMNYDTNPAANAENRDAFYKVESFKVEGNMTRKVELKRPFAQINIGTNDWADVEKNENVSIENTGITVKTYPTLNFKNGKAEGNATDVTFTPSTMPVGEKFPVGAENEYKYLSMNYILATTEKQVVDVTISYNNAVQDRTFTAVPVQRNYRTNIYGKLITSDEQFNVEIKPDFDGAFDDEQEGPTVFEPVSDNPTANGTALHNMIMNGADGTTYYLPYGTYRLGSGSSSRFNGKSFTLIGLPNENGEYPVLESDGKYGMVIQDSFDPNSSVTVNLQNLTIGVDRAASQRWGAIYVKYNVTVNLENVNVYSGAPIQLDNANKYEDGQYYANTKTVVNAKNVVALEDGNNVATLLALPCSSTNQELVTFAYLNTEGGNITSAKAEAINVAEGNCFFNGEVLANSKATTLVISDVASLVAMSNKTIKGGQKVVLTADLDLEGVDFKGLNAFNPEDPNTFDGNGHTVSNWTNNSGSSDLGFIKNWVGPIKNLTIKNSHLKTGGRSAILAAKVYGDIDNCHVVDCSLNDAYWAAGLIAGLYNNGSISNCTVTGSSIKSNGGVGGIVGAINETARTRNVTNCVVTNSVIDYTGIYGPDYVGGAICGMINVNGANVSFAGCRVENCNIDNILGSGSEGNNVTY